VLITVEEQRMKLLFHGPTDKNDRELSWLDWSLLSSLSPDGKFVAFDESGEGAGGAQLCYLRETSGSPAVLLGNGAAATLSGDQQSVVAIQDNPSAIVVYPVGPGQTKTVALRGFTLSMAGLMPGGKRLWFNGNEPSHGTRYYMTDLEGAKPRPLTPEGARVSSLGLVINGKYLAGTAGGKLCLYPVEGGEPEILPGIREGERIIGWSQEEDAIFVDLRGEFPSRVYRLDRKTGKRDLLLELAPTDRAGFEMGPIHITPDGKTYAYSARQQLSELQLVEGLR
jgi:Tol biopolymer transport system component